MVQSVSVIGNLRTLYFLVVPLWQASKVFELLELLKPSSEKVSLVGLKGPIYEGEKTNERGLQTPMGHGDNFGRNGCI